MAKAIQIAKQGLGPHYHPAVLADVWRRAAPAHWARLALLACLSPDDAQDPKLRSEVLVALGSMTTPGGST